MSTFGTIENLLKNEADTKSQMPLLQEQSEFQAAPSTLDAQDTRQQAV